MDYRIERRTATAAKRFQRVRGWLNRIGFWGSILLPIAYPPILYGTSGATRGFTFAGVLVAHVTCLVLGHEYPR
jgi:hypothetical protein